MRLAILGYLDAVGGSQGFHPPVQGESQRRDEARNNTDK